MSDVIATGHLPRGTPGLALPQLPHPQRWGPLLGLQGLGTSPGQKPPWDTLRSPSAGTCTTINTCGLGYKML